MKKAFFSLLAMLTVTSVFSQELRVNTVDEFTKTSKKITKTYTLAKGVTTIKGYVGRFDSSYAFYAFPNLDLGCCGASGNYVIFLFDDGTSHKLDSDVAKIDCTAGSTSIYMIDPADFAGKVITKIRFAQSGSYDDCTWTGEFTLQQLIGATK